MPTHIPANSVVRYTGKMGRYVQMAGDIGTRYVARNVPTKSGRSVKYVEHTLTVTGWLYAADLPNTSATYPLGTTDLGFERAEEILTTQGGILTINGKGLGDWNVNNNVSKREPLWGPIPEMIDWEPFGNVTCRFTWKVKWASPADKQAYTLGQILDFWWETDYQYDSAGFCTRTVNGELEIAANLSNPVNRVRTISSYDQIETFLYSYVQCDCPLGYTRQPGHGFRVNAARTGATFRFTDVQNKGTHNPPGIAEFDAEHEMHCQATDMSLSNWIWTFHAQATPNASEHPILGYQACLAAFASRFKFVMGRLVTNQGVICPLPVMFKIKEGVKSRTTTLTASWLIMAAGGRQAPGQWSPVDILFRSGMWQPMPFDAKSQKQVADQPLGPNRSGGFGQLVSDRNQNIIMDLSTVGATGSGYGGLPDVGRVEKGTFSGRKQLDYNLWIMAPYGAYIEFKAAVLARTEGGTWTNYPLVPKGKTNPKGGWDGRKGFQQKMHTPYNEYRLVGYILRVGIPAEGVPNIKRIGDMTVHVPAGKQALVNSYPFKNLMGAIVFRTDFDIPLVPGDPDNSNPIKRPPAGAVNSKNTPPAPPPKDADMAQVKDDQLGIEPTDMEVIQDYIKAGGSITDGN